MTLPFVLLSREPIHGLEGRVRKGRNEMKRKRKGDGIPTQIKYLLLGQGSLSEFLANKIRMTANTGRVTYILHDCLSFFLSSYFSSLFLGFFTFLLSLFFPATFTFQLFHLIKKSLTVHSFFRDARSVLPPPPLLQKKNKSLFDSPRDSFD